ncbi:hypothetical protein GY31_09250 [Lysinibacillus sphaericus]|uniref:AlbA family DNA-binding domain-containing protein n=1 Tax=Lysinibacillus TaxID=400634 RepID=UPI00084AB32F|nr:ATP-binding protein [Lysinibacillus sphaericus]OEC02125.1 hypothetical protein GY31_09250 [Lysinibacillus sphaericus]
MFDSERGINARKIKNISEQIKSGAQYENPVIELKREFWDLSNDEGRNEFAKDLTVMANSQYDVGNIIVGIDGKTGDLHHTTLPLDAASLANIISRKVLEPFTVEFIEIQVNYKNIIVVHIPRTYNKPHMLRLYKNREMFIPMRKGTRTQAADKYDLDLMYTERERIVIPPYRIEPFNGDSQLIINPLISRGNFSWSCLINVLNTGSRINLVIGGSIRLFSGDIEIAKHKLNSYYIPGTTKEWQDIRSNNFIKISQNDAIRVNFGFHIANQEQYLELKSQLNSGCSAQISLIDVAGNESYTGIIPLWLKD